MNIVVIGNTKTNGETIRKIATMLIDSGVSVRYPSEEGLDTGEEVNIEETFDRVDWCDCVIAVPREGITFGYATTYEMTYAKHVNKPVLIYYG